MDYSFSSRVDAILSGRSPAGQVQDLLNLGTGAPPEQFLPLEEILPISSEILTKEPVAALQYSITEGYAPLRESIRTMLNRKWPLCRPEDQVLILSGSTQGIDLTVKSFCDQGDSVLCAANTPENRLGLFHAYGARPVFVRTGPDSLDLADLEQKALHSKARFLYVMPDFADPDGSAMPLANREALYQLARRLDLILLEDGSMNELWVQEEIPPIKSLDEDGRVIYCGSFSNILAPALRLGYLSANSEVVGKLTVAKQCCDVHTTVWSQMVVYQLLEKGLLPTHLQKVRAWCASQLQAVLPAAQELFAGKASFFPPKGGLFLALELPPSRSAQETASQASARGVGVAVAGPHTLRINFCAYPAPKVLDGLSILASLL